MAEPSWQDVGSVEELKTQPLQQIRSAKTLIALSYMNGQFSAVSGVCNHVGGPLGEGTLDGDYIVCPWHYWKFNRVTGEGEQGFEDDCVPRNDVKVENDSVIVNVMPSTHRH